MPIINNSQAGNFTVDGAYVYEAPSQSVTPTGAQTNLIGVVGAANWGPLNTQTVFSDASSAYAAFGNLTNNVNALVRTALSGMPECNNFVGIRVSDGSDTAATIAIKDAQSTPGTVLTLTAVHSGSYANTATATVSLQSGTATAAPVYSITISFPNANPIVYSGIAGSTGGGAYASATFVANAIAAINGTAPNTSPNPYFVASAGTSTFAPNTTSFTASGGTDGATSITSTILIGTDGATNRTGMYALRGAVAGGQVVIAGLSDLTQFANVAEFVQQESAIGHIAIPSGANTATAVSDKVAANASSRFMVVNAFWDYVQDSSSGLKLLVDPSGAVAGIIAGQPAYKYVGNKPYTGKAGIVSTERSVVGAMSQSEQGQLQQNGIMYLTNAMPRGNGLFGLPHGKASDGSNIDDTRMLNYCAQATLSILGPFVGEMQSAQKGDPTRAAARASLSGFYQTLLSQQQIAAYSITLDSTNNSSTTVQQGFLLANIAVTTLSGVEFALATLQVGNTVQITVNQAA